MTVNEALAIVIPDMSIKQALGVFLFYNTLSTLGTERHRQIARRIWGEELVRLERLTTWECVSKTSGVLDVVLCCIDGSRSRQRHQEHADDCHLRQKYSGIRHSHSRLRGC